MTGEPLQRVISTMTNKESSKGAEDLIHQANFMNMISHRIQMLEENYLGKETRKLNVINFQVGFDPEKGYATTDDPALISCYMSWTDVTTTYWVQ